jgi:hypothetical protein
LCVIFNHSSEWVVAGDEDQAYRVGAHSMEDQSGVPVTPNGRVSGKGGKGGSPLSPNRLPPTLLQMLRHAFKAADVDHSGTLDYDEFWHLCQGLGLGLSDDDIYALQLKADISADGEVDWRELLPVASELLTNQMRQHYSSGETDDDNDEEGGHARRAERKNPWVKLYDWEAGEHYLFNRHTEERFEHVHVCYVCVCTCVAVCKATFFF